MYKVGDKVVLIANRRNIIDSLETPYNGSFSHLKGKTLRIIKVFKQGLGWHYELEGELFVKSDQIVPARIAKTEIYKALTEET